ncbi:MAG: radical SAM protein, partial [Pseudomonadota bacterium]
MDDSLPPASSNDQARPSRMIKGRGAASNPEGRFESIRHQAEDDGWQSALLDEDAPRPRT